MSNYILQKDLPDSKAGDKYIWSEIHEVYFRSGDINGTCWTADRVENNPEWFKKVEEKIKVTGLTWIGNTPGTHFYQFFTDKEISSDHFIHIMKSIESVVNRKPDIYESIKPIDHFVKREAEQVQTISTYTKEDLMNLLRFMHPELGEPYLLREFDKWQENRKPVSNGVKDY